MFHRNQAALFSIQLLAVCYVLAELDNYEQVQVVSGDPVIFNCNISGEKELTQINWTKDKFLSAHKISGNETITISNFTYQTVTIDPCCFSNLTILSAQHEDTGLYKCVVTYKRDITTVAWNLAVPEEHKVPETFIYGLAPVVGLLLCGITAAVCLYRKVRSRSPYEEPVQVQSPPQSDAEAALHTQTDERMNKNHRSQYMERLNSIYGL